MGILDSFKTAMGGKADAEADEMRVAAPEPAEQGSYTVQSGDTLWNIAETVYGDGSKYAKIFDANTDLLEHPDRIFPGQKLLIPDLDD